MTTTKKVEAIMVFSASLAKKAEENRLPPNYVGVRRVRASNQKVRDALRSNDVALTSIKTPVVFKVTEKDGTERRMTAQEKKELKLRLRKERYEARKRQKRDAAAEADSNVSTSTDSAQNPKKASLNYCVVKDSSGQCTSNDPSILIERQKRNYHQLEVSAAALEEEISELRGEKKGVPPVILNPPMAQQGCGSFLQLPSGSTALTDSVDIKPSILDDALAGEWAAALKESMKPAENVRAKERMRPMAYQLVPEAWTRLRPVFEEERSIQNSSDEDDKNRASPLGQEELSSESTSMMKPWSTVTIRQRMEPFDSDISIVYDFLYQHSKLHISCGSKFGCDFLVYDGRREDRHAFAGLRVYSAPSDPNSQFPIPSAYDLAGYVRTLNTAGKLALLATVKRDPGSQDSFRIAIVDLALEKILSAPTHQKRRSRSSMKARREVGEKLSKTNATS